MKIETNIPGRHPGDPTAPARGPTPVTPNNAFGVGTAARRRAAAGPASGSLAALALPAERTGTLDAGADTADAEGTPPVTRATRGGDTGPARRDDTDPPPPRPAVADPEAAPEAGADPEAEESARPPSAWATPAPAVSTAPTPKPTPTAPAPSQA